MPCAGTCSVCDMIVHKTVSCLCVYGEVVCISSRGDDRGKEESRRILDSFGMALFKVWIRDNLQEPQLAASNSQLRYVSTGDW